MTLTKKFVKAKRSRKIPFLIVLFTSFIIADLVVNQSLSLLGIQVYYPHIPFQEAFRDTAIEGGGIIFKTVGLVNVFLHSFILNGIAMLWFLNKFLPLPLEEETLRGRDILESQQLSNFIDLHIQMSQIQQEKKVGRRKALWSIFKKRNF